MDISLPEMDKDATEDERLIQISSLVPLESYNTV